MSIDLDFEEAYHGAKRLIEYPCNVICDSCEGTGIRRGEQEIVCNHCNGTGFIEQEMVGGKMSVR